ncbi:MAG TPA: hypothetical protein VMC09_05735 [Anaerolineales bacterium]|nr:hypothetical protein [Anaerolineales bacterium]
MHIPDNLQSILVVIAGIVLLFGLFEIIGLFITLVTDLWMRLFAWKNHLEYQPGRCSQFFGKPFVLTNTRGFAYTIKVFARFGTKYSHSSICLAATVDNPGRVSLVIKNRSFMDRRVPFFHNEWDRRLGVESNPVSFGRELLASTSTLKTVKGIVGAWGSLHGSRIRVTPAGKIEIWKSGEGFTSWQVNRMVRFAGELAERVGQFGNRGHQA